MLHIFFPSKCFVQSLSVLPVSSYRLQTWYFCLFKRGIMFTVFQTCLFILKPHQELLEGRHTVCSDNAFFEKAFWAQQLLLLENNRSVENLFWTPFYWQKTMIPTLFFFFFLPFCSSQLIFSSNSLKLFLLWLAFAQQSVLWLFFGFLFCYENNGIKVECAPKLSCYIFS